MLASGIALLFFVLLTVPFIKKERPFGVLRHGVSERLDNHRQAAQNLGADVVDQWPLRRGSGCLRGAVFQRDSKGEVGQVCRVEPYAAVRGDRAVQESCR